MFNLHWRYERRRVCLQRFEIQIRGTQEFYGDESTQRSWEEEGLMELSVDSWSFVATTIQGEEKSSFPTSCQKEGQKGDVTQHKTWERGKKVIWSHRFFSVRDFSSSSLLTVTMYTVREKRPMVSFFCPQKERQIIPILIDKEFEPLNPTGRVRRFFREFESSLASLFHCNLILLWG